MNSARVAPGIRRAISDAREALDPGVAERESRAVALCAAMTAQSLASELRTFTGDPAEVTRQRRRAELLAAELGALENLCAELVPDANNAASRRRQCFDCSDAKGCAPYQDVQAEAIDSGDIGWLPAPGFILAACPLGNGAGGQS